MKPYYQDDAVTIVEITDEEAERWLKDNDLYAVTHLHTSSDCAECQASGAVSSRDREGLREALDVYREAERPSIEDEWYERESESGRSGLHSPATPDDLVEGAIGENLPSIDTHLQIDRIHAADCWCNPLGPNGRPGVPLDGDDRPKVMFDD
jgi:hypothetical protein